jgi:hypothetical protein
VAYPTYPAAPAQPPRPTTVTISTYLLWLTALVSLITGALTVSMVGRMADVYRELYEGTAAEGTEGFIVGVSVFIVVINLLFAAGLAILGIFNNRGRNGARITTWVLGAISLCCSGFGLAGTAVTSSMNLDSSTGTNTGPTNAELEAALNRVLPSWFEPLSLVLTVISLLAILGAVILLALPASNAYFRKAQPAWDPNQQLPYPGQPGYPPPGAYQPGQPPAQPYQPGQQPYQQGQPYQPGQQSYPESQPPSSGSGLPPYPGQDPPSAPPASGPTPPTDPWGRPADDDKRPPADPTS